MAANLFRSANLTAMAHGQKILNFMCFGRTVNVIFRGHLQPVIIRHCHVTSTETKTYIKQSSKFVPLRKVVKEFLDDQSTKNLLLQSSEKLLDDDFDSKIFANDIIELVDRIHRRELTEIPWLRSDPIIYMWQLCHTNKMYVIENGDEEVSASLGPELLCMLERLHQHVEKLDKKDILIIQTSMAEHNLMQLNRLLILDCPEFHIPWIMEKLKHASKGVIGRPRIIGGIEFEPVLQRLAGSDGYISKPNLPYHYTADFELYVDKKGSILRHKAGSESSDPSIRRVVILIMLERYYCFNSDRIKGSVLEIIRHLQILGCNVVLIPLAEWKTVEYESFQTKVNYVQRKIQAVLED